MLLTMPLIPDMGKNVLQLLEKLNPLPSTGFIAGQSVLSALLQLYGKGQVGPINDIDIYKNDNRINYRIKHLSFQPEASQIGFYKPDASVLKKPHYEGITQFFNTKRISLFHIADVTYENLLNIIKIKSADDTLNVTPYQVLESFDLNMVKVGVSLKTKKLYWTPDFEFFIKTGQLQVTNTHSVFHTSCRIVKKLDEMPWIYTNPTLNYKTLVLPSQISKKIHGREIQFNAFFGKKYFGIFNKYPELQKLFDVKEKETKHKNKDPDKIKKTGLYTCTFTEELTKNVTSSDTDSYIDLLEYNFKTRDRISAAHALSKHFINKKYLQKGKHYANALTTLSANTSDYVKSQISLFEQDFLDGQVQIEWANRIEKFVNKHDKLTYLFTGNSLDVQSKIYTNIKKLQSLYGEHIIGLIETSTITIPDILDYDQMSALIIDYNKKLTTPFKNFEALPTKLYGNIQIRDLPNKLSIKAEGLEMHHCVGGYADTVNSGRSRILSISDTTNSSSRTARSTAEVSSIDNRKLALLGITDKTLNTVNNFKYPICVIQHRAFANAIPLIEHQDALAKYITEHNLKYINLSDNVKELFLYSEITGLEQDIQMLYLGKLETIHISIMTMLETLLTFIDTGHHFSTLPVAGIKITKNNKDIIKYLIYLDKTQFYIAVPSVYNTEVLSLDVLEKQIQSNGVINLDMNKQLAFYIVQAISNLNLNDFKEKFEQLAVSESKPSKYGKPIIQAMYEDEEEIAF